MSRVERDFRRNLTRRVRAIVQASPEMRDEWQRRHPRMPRMPLWRRVIHVIGVAILPPLALLMMVYISTLVSMAVLYPHVRRMWGDPQAMLIPTSDYALTPMTLVVFAIVLFTSALGNVVLGPGSELLRLSHFPIADNEHLRRGVLRIVLLGAISAACLVPAYAGIAMFERLSVWQITGMIVCVLLQGAHCLALLVAISPRIRHYTAAQAAMIFTAVGLLAAGLLANGVSEHVWRHWQTVASIILATPVGWANAAIAYGVIGGHWWGWLFLLPMPMAFFAAFWWLRRGYAIREVLIGSEGTASPIYEFGLANSVSVTIAPPPRVSVPVETAQDDSSTMADAAHLRKRILSGEALAPLDWSKLGFIERYVGSHLTDRERATVEHVCHRRLSWTRAWWIAAAAGIPLMAILLAARFDLPEPGKLKADLSIMMWLFCLAIGEGLAHFRLSDLVTPRLHHNASPCHPLFPVDPKATVAALVRVYWLRLPLWLPLCVAAVLVLAAGRPDWPVFVVLNLLLAVVVTRLAIGLLARMPFGGASAPIISWWRIAVMVPIALLWFAAAIGVFWYVHWIVSVASLAVLTLAVWITNQHIDAHHLYVSDFDVPSPTRRGSRLARASAA